MICPKCRFDQPDDAYCAFCGINIKKYRQERRKKQYALYVLVSFAVIAGVFVAVNAIHQVKTPESVTQMGEDQAKDIDLPGTGREGLKAKQASRTRKDMDRQRRSRSASFGSERLEDEGPSEIESSQEFPLAEPTTGSVPETDRGEQLTAKEWFEKGIALDDESESEIEFYQKALELNPEYAPAYYRLGAIHFRHARYELADQEFTKFIQHASEADRQAYDIYVYYSPSDMERLSATAVTEKVSGEEEEKEALGEAPGTEREVSGEFEGEEKEAPSEAEEVEKMAEEMEEGQTEAGEEAEEIEKEAPEEAEEAETATPAEIPEETEEEREEVETETPAELPKEAEEETEY
jgi:tetratricopeptide (TPR) repeat protein